MSANHVRRNLEGMVTTAAVGLMAADADTYLTITQGVLATLVDYLRVDAGFLRYNDHEIRASRLVAEWPPRPDVRDPDPLSIVYFEDADPVIVESEHGKQPRTFRRGGEDRANPVDDERAGPETSTATAPLVSGELTTGVIGFTRFRGRHWEERELDVLAAIGSLFAQVQARVSAEQRLRHLADHDDLTGLYNRRALLSHLDDRLSSDRAGPVTVLSLDLDRLKTINDHLGHSAGDWFLRVLAQRLGERSERDVVIARLGGDEFVVVPPEPTSVAAAESLARTLLTLLREPVAFDGELLTRTVSIGVARGCPGTDSNEDLLRRADQALLAAKTSGGNRVAVYSAEMSAESEYRTEIELHLGSAIEGGALFVRYLPEFDMETGRILAVEALVRWNHPTRGPIPPATLVAVAESIDLARELGRWVMRTACADLAGWRASGLGRATVLRINVSPVQLVTDGFSAEVAAIVSEFGLEPGSICLEITESVVVQDIDTTRITLAQLKKAGVQIAIDDFGTGYSVLSHLKALPVDVLKIDRSFVTDLGANPDDLVIVRAIIALADAFDLEVVAEGVESEVAAVTLLRHGCHRAQGFLLSPPIGASAVGSFLAEGRLSAQFRATPGA